MTHILRKAFFRHAPEISELYYNNFAVIRGEKGYGVVSAEGNIIIDPVYQKVNWEALPVDGDSYGYNIIFKCQESDGYYKIIKWDTKENGIYFSKQLDKF